MASSNNATKPLPLSITVPDSYSDTSVNGYLHLPPNLQNRTAAILLSGAGGGVVGPSSIYLSIARKLSNLPNAAHAVPVLRLDYRHPARTRQCSADVVAAMNHLETHHSIKQFVLVGWSFGGAPVFTVAGNNDRVVGCATVASQTADTDGIRRLPPRPVLLLHGTADMTLSDVCSKRLLEAYLRSGGKRGVGGGELRLFDGDDHGLTRNAVRAEELISTFILRCAGVELDDGGVEKGRLKEDVMKGGIEERKELMRKAGDLDGERLE